MKKLTLIALIAMMLIGMLAFSACQTEEVEETVDEAAEGIEAAADTAMAVVDTMAAEVNETVTQ
ncbi:MAG: hypothetical protein PHD87_08665 [Candidatus Cloacimonetes bacterium]|nr:hypothetical protein [Candidatus Cloacimonadota bacterium]